MTWNRKLALTLALSMSLCISDLLAQSVAVEPSAWDLWNGDEAGDDSLATTPLERRLLQVLTPIQVERYLDGEDPKSIVLQDGRTLAEFIASFEGSSPWTIDGNDIFYDLGNVGVGGDPSQPLHVIQQDAKIVVEDTNTTSAIRSLLELRNRGRSQFRMENTANGAAWTFDISNQGDRFFVSRAGTGTVEMTVNQTGDVGIAGNVTSGGSLTFDGATDQITAGSGTVDFDDENLITTGMAEVTSLRVTAGAVDGHVLTTDAAGNATWQAPAGGGNFVDLTSDQSINGTKTFTDEIEAPDGARIGNPNSSTNLDIYTSGTAINLFRVGGLQFGEVRTNSDNDFVLEPRNGKLRTQSDLYLQFSSGSSWRNLFAGDITTNGSLFIHDSNGVRRGGFQTSGANVQFFDGTDDGYLEIRDRLQVSGDSSDQYLTLGPVNLPPYISFQEGLNQTRDLEIQMGSGSDGTLMIDGDLAITGSCSGCSSDKSLKQNISLLPDALDRILELRAVTFDWASGSQEESTFRGPQIGVIAQEVEAIFPELVGTDGRGLKYVRYQKLVAPLIGAIQQQQETIKALRALVCLDRPTATICQNQ